jgi:hypothetical protein
VNRDPRSTEALTVATICERDSRVVRGKNPRFALRVRRAAGLASLNFSRFAVIMPFFGRSKVVLVCGDIQLWSTLVKSHAQDVGDDQAAIKGDDAVQDLPGQVAKQRQR